MSGKQATFVILLALIAGFGGGVASRQIGATVQAQAGPAERIEAQEFRLVDANGRVMGLIRPTATAASEGPAVVVPFGQNRQSGSGAIMLFDTLGRPTWTAPETLDPPARLRPLTKAK